MSALRLAPGPGNFSCVGLEKESLNLPIMVVTSKRFQDLGIAIKFRIRFCRIYASHKNSPLCAIIHLDRRLSECADMYMSYTHVKSPTHLNLLVDGGRDIMVGSNYVHVRG